MIVSITPSGDLTQCVNDSKYYPWLIQCINDSKYQP